jgi:hypothetical protein
MIDDIKRDRENGTPGPFKVFSGTMVRGPAGNTLADCRYKNGANDAPRFARVPDMEAALLAADELADAVSEFLKGPYHELAQPLAAYRKATGANL